MAERVGFEPTVELPLHTISSRAPSATRSPLLETTTSNCFCFKEPQPWRSWLKNCRITCEHSSASTPSVTSIRWFNRGSATRLPRLPQ